jgi:hypothetical protein
MCEDDLLDDVESEPKAFAPPSAWMKRLEQMLHLVRRNWLTAVVDVNDVIVPGIPNGDLDVAIAMGGAIADEVRNELEYAIGIPRSVTSPSTCMEMLLSGFTARISSSGARQRSAMFTFLRTIGISRRR